LDLINSIRGGQARRIAPLDVGWAKSWAQD